MAMQLPTANDAPGTGRGLKRSDVRLITVFFMIYILVSGGSFGIEDMVSSSGPGLTILLLLPAAHLLEPADGARRQRARFGPAGRGRLLHLGAPRPGRTSGASRRPGGGRCRSSSTRRCTSCWPSATCRTGCISTSLWFYVICWAIIAAFTIMNIVGVQLIALSARPLFSVHHHRAVRGAHRRSGWRSGSSTRSRRSRRRACRSSAPTAPSVWAWPSACGCTRATSRCLRSRARSAIPRRSFRAL